MSLFKYIYVYVCLFATVYFLFFSFLKLPDAPLEVRNHTTGPLIEVVQSMFWRRCHRGLVLLIRSINCTEWTVSRSVSS
jgi:hypothetical protein